MSRAQSLVTLGTVLVASPGTPVPLSVTPIYVKSFIVQARPANTDFVYIGDASAQLQALEPRRSLKVWGDNLDNGTTGKINLADVFIDGPVAGEGVTVTYLRGL